MIVLTERPVLAASASSIFQSPSASLTVLEDRPDRLRPAPGRTPPRFTRRTVLIFKCGTRLWPVSARRSNPSVVSLRGGMGSSPNCFRLDASCAFAAFKVTDGRVEMNRRVLSATALYRIGTCVFTGVIVTQTGSGLNPGLAPVNLPCRSGTTISRPSPRLIHSKSVAQATCSSSSHWPVKRWAKDRRTTWPPSAPPERVRLQA